ncbi:hypothetical protein SK128_014768, partial [Halocaridina rubra]
MVACVKHSPQGNRRFGRPRPTWAIPKKLKAGDEWKVIEFMSFQRGLLRRTLLEAMR